VYVQRYACVAVFWLLTSSAPSHLAEWFDIWYQLMQVVLECQPLNRCGDGSSSSSNANMYVVVTPVRVLHKGVH